MISANRWPGGEPVAAEGWALRRLTPPSVLYGANGMCFGPDGRLYVAQHYGSQVSALDIATGTVDVICPKGGPLLAVDDLAFDSAGVLYVTETMANRVGAVGPDGRTWVVQDGLPEVNGITCHRDRLFVDECRPDGRVLEIFRDSREPRVLLEGRAAPNACAVGPDERLYFPEVISGQVWAVPLDGGEATVVLDGVAAPVAVKFDPVAGRLTTLAAATGEVVQCDPDGGGRSVLAVTRPGFDNCAYTPDGRLFVSYCVDGGISEIVPDGEERIVVAPGFVYPLGLAVLPGGDLLVGDHLGLHRLGADGSGDLAGSFFHAGFPGTLRGVASGPGHEVYVTTAGGAAAGYHPAEGRSEILAANLDQPMGIAVRVDGRVVVCEAGRQRVVEIEPGSGPVTVLATGLEFPADVVVTADAVLVSDAGRGAIVRIADGCATPVVDGLGRPHGLAIFGGGLAVVDVAEHALVFVDLETGKSSIAATGLPVGSPPGVTPRVLPGLGLIPGPFHPFSALVCRGDELLLGADGDGSIVSITRGS